MIKFGLLVQEALCVTKKVCSRKYLHRMVKEAKEKHGDSIFARRQIGIGIPLETVTVANNNEVTGISSLTTDGDLVLEEA